MSLEGTSLVPVMRDTDAAIRDAAMTQHQQPFYGSSKNWKAWGYSVRTDRWRYTEWSSIEDRSIIARELYDHRNDPLETNNVALLPSNATAVRELSQRLSRLRGWK